MFRLWLRDLFPAVSRPAPRAAARRARPQVLSLEDRVNPAPLVSISDATLIEGDAGTSLMTFTVNLDVTDAADVTVDYATADGTASAASDYVAAANTVTVLAGTLSKTFTVTINGDTTVEADETFTATLSNPSKNASIGKAVGTGTILNDDKTTLTLAPSAASTAEGASITYTVTSSNAVQGGFSVAVSATPNAPATAADITLSSGTLTFAGGVGEAQTFTVLAVADGVVEPTETFSVALGAVTPTQAITAGNFVAVGSPTTTSITDADTTTLTVGDVTRAENNGPMTFTVTSSNAVQGNFTVDYATSDVTAVAGANYKAKSGTLTFAGAAAGQAQTFTVTLLDDGVVSGDKTFKVTLSNPANAVGIPAKQFVVAAPATGTIANADKVTLTVTGVAQAEDKGATTFTVTSSAAVAGGFKVSYATADGTALVSNGDYAAASGTLTFAGAAGETQTFTVAVTADAVVEADETFTASLNTIAPNDKAVATSDFVVAGVGAATILNDDSAVITVSEPTVTEGGTLGFVFTLSNLVDVPVTFQFDAMLVGPATSANFTSVVGKMVTIPAYTKSVQFDVTTVDDRRVQGKEAVNEVLSKLDTATNMRPTVTLDTTPRSATIADNDTAVVSFSKAGDSFPEDNKSSNFNALLTITATGVGTVGLDRDVTASFTRGGNAISGAAGSGVGVGNYLATFPGGVTFPAGDGTVFAAPVKLTVFENLTNDGTKTATVTLGLPSDPTGGQVKLAAPTVYTLDILNDDNLVRTYDATDSGDYRLVRNGPNVELYRGPTRVAVDVYGTAAILFNGTAGDDSLQIDYVNGNPVPADGVTFDGKGGNDRLTVTLGSFAKISSALLSANSGAITFTGGDPSLNGVVKYANVTLETQLDPASVAEVNFALPAGGSSSRLQEDDGGAGNGLAKFAPADPLAPTFVSTRFLVPTALFSLDRGKATDAVDFASAPSNPSDLRSSVRVGNPAAPFAVLTLSGRLVSDGAVDFNADTIALSAQLTAVASVSLVAGTLATQSPAGSIITAALQLGVGGKGDYTLVVDNSVTSLGANTTGRVAYRDANSLVLAGVAVGGTFDLAVDGELTQTAPVVVAGATRVTDFGNAITLTNPANDFSSLRLTNVETRAGRVPQPYKHGPVRLTDANAIVLAGVITSGDLTLVTGDGAVTQTAPVVAFEVTTLVTGGGNVTLADAANKFGSLLIVSGGADTIRSDIDVTLLGATLGALDVQSDKDLLVTGTVNATAGSVAARAGNTLRVSPGRTVRATTTIALEVDTVGVADPDGGTVDLRGADLVATSSTITGGTDADLFQLTGTTTPVTIDGKAPTGSSTGDRLDFDAQGKDVAATPDSFNTAGAAVRYLDIETVRLLNPAAVTLDGTAGDDVATIARAPNGPLTYRLNNGVPVEAAGTTRFRFNGLAGSDTLVVDFKPGDPVPAGGVVFDGGSGSDVGLCVLGAGDLATFTTTSVGADLSGRVTVGTSILDFVNFETTSQVDLTNMANVAVDFVTADDALTVSNGFDATAGKTNPALVVSGAKTPRVGLWNNANVTLSTAGNDGNDTVTIVSADNAHGNTNLTVLTGAGTDAVTVAGNVAVAGSFRLQSQAVTVGTVAVTAQSGGVRIENAKTLTLIGSTVTAGTSFAQADGGAVALTGTATVTARGGDIVFSGPVSGPGSLVANTAGQTLFAQSVGELVPLLDLSTDAGGRTDFFGPVVQTANSQSFGDPVSYAQNDTKFLGKAGTIAFLSTLLPAATGLDLTVGGPNVDVGFADAVGKPGFAVGTLRVPNARNLTANGPVTAAALRQEAGTGTTTLNGAVTLANDLTVTNAKNLTLNGPVTAATFQQAGGTGTTLLNGPLTASGGTPVTGGLTGGAINVGTATAILSGPISASKQPIVLSLTNGATQPAGQFSTTKLYLNGAGVFKLDQPGNALTDGTAELFVALAGGTVSVRDSSALFIRSEVDSTPAIRLKGAGDVTLTTAGDFTAEDPRAQPNFKEGGQAVPASKLTPLFDLADGTLRVRFSVGRAGSESGNLTFVAEAIAKEVVLGQDPATSTDRAFDNVSKDRFVVRPALGAPVTVNGNLPVAASGLNFAPYDSLSPQFVGIDAVNLLTQGEGNGLFTFAGTDFKQLRYTSIETFEGRGVEAFVVQTAPRLGSAISSAYSVRVSQSQNVAGRSVTVNTTLDGSGIIPNPFVVSPSLLSPAVAYTAPRLTLADVDGDGLPDLIIANGAGDAPAVTIIDGRALNSTAPLNLSTLDQHPENLLTQFFPFGENFRGGLSVATGDFDGDGKLEIVVGAGVGGGPRVQVFKIDDRPTFSSSLAADKSTVRTALTTPNGSGKDVAVAYQNVKEYRPDAFNFFAFESSQRGGVNVAVGDFNGDGTPDIVVGAGVGGGPRVRIISGKNGVAPDPQTGVVDPIINDFFAYDPNFRGGVFVDAGRYDLGPTADLVTAPGVGGGPHIKVFLGSGTRAGLVTPEVVGFMAYDLPGTGLVGGDAGASAYQTGVGSVAFGASLDPASKGGRRSILVTTPRGSGFSVTRFDSPAVATTVPAGPGKVTQYEQTLAAINQVPSATINVSALDTPPEFLPFASFRDGGSVTGFAAVSKS